MRIEPVYRPAAAPRRKFQSRVWLHATLFVATLLTTTLVGALHYAAYTLTAGGQINWREQSFYLHGFWYSLAVLAILGAHEMGHYLMCRRYNTDASLPYFLPFLLPLPVFQIGTLGAVIRIREPFANRKVLFDVGIAGPIAGFAVLVPLLFIGLAKSSIVPLPTDAWVYNLGEPLLFKWAVHLIFGTVAATQTINLHPLVLAAWFGMLATALNLLPFGQLDGGHIVYAAADRISTAISLATVSFGIIMTVLSRSWILMTALMVVMLWLFGPRHPRVINEHEPLDPGRRALAFFALLMLVLCFTPVPVDVVFLKH